MSQASDAESQLSDVPNSEFGDVDMPNSSNGSNVDESNDDKADIPSDDIGNANDGVVANNEDDVDLNIDFIPLANYRHCLPLPHRNDSFDTFVRNLRALSDVVQAGKSIAVATGFAYTLLDPEKRGYRKMYVDEYLQYYALRNGAPFPVFDFVNNRKHMRGKSRALMEKHAAALNTAYGMNQFVAQHAAWVVKHRKGMVPLLRAIEKVAVERRRTTRVSQKYREMA